MSSAEISMKLEGLERRVLLSAVLEDDVREPPGEIGADEHIEMWVRYVPKAEQTEIEISRQEGRVVAGVHLVFPDAGFRVADWGTPVRDGNRIVADAQVMRWTGPSPQVITEASHRYDFGALPAGEYVFTFKAWGETVKRAEFRVEGAPERERLVLLASEADDVYEMRLDDGGRHVVIAWNNDPALRPTPLIVDLERVESIALDALEGNDAVVLDLKRGVPLPAGGMTYHGGSGRDRLVIANAGAEDEIRIAASEVRINGIVVRVESVEEIVVQRTEERPEERPVLRATDEREVMLEGGEHLSALELSGSARVVLPAGGGRTLTVDELLISESAQIDVNDNELVVMSSRERQAADLAALQRLVASGRNGGSWDGAGITSSAAAADASGLFGLVVAPVAVEEGGLSVSAADDAVALVVKYTLHGDLDLNGVVDIDDYFLMDTGFLDFQAGVSGDPAYWQADLDLNGVVDIDDYFLIDTAFLGQDGVLD